MFGSTLDYVKPSEAQLELMQEFREKMGAIFAEIKEKLPENRGRSIALTKFEESAMWVNKSITENC